MNFFDDVQIDQKSFSWLDLLSTDRWDTWTVVRTGWTDVGTPTVTGRFKVMGKLCAFQCRVVPGTTVATTAGTSYIALPVASKGVAGMATMSNATSNLAVGVAHIDTTNSRCYLPTQGASNNVFAIAGWYEV